MNMKKVLGLGNALVDIMTQLDTDDFLKRYKLQKGSMQLVDQEFSTGVLEGAAHLRRELASGGSAANTIHGLSRLGVPCSFIGTVGKDDYGRFFREDMEKAGIRPTLYEGQAATGRAIALVSPDSQRTFATFLGAAIELSAKDLQASHFEGYDYFHIEGYLVQNYDLVERAIELAGKAGAVISLDLASYNVVEQHLDFLKKIISKGVGIVFANEEEAHAFTGLNAEDALHLIGGMTKIAVVKTGEKGSLIKSGDDLFRIEAVAARCIDTTGAGDLYASGFLYGLANNLELPLCGKAGSLLAGQVIEGIGAKIPDDRWENIRSAIRQLV